MKADHSTVSLIKLVINLLTFGEAFEKAQISLIAAYITNTSKNKVKDLEASYINNPFIPQA